MELDKTYNYIEIEKKWYELWSQSGAFRPKAGKANKTYTIVMPPPNVTGRLHMGHALDNTCQDVLIRFKRMKGFEALWIPGQDHAGIATQAKVEELIYKEEKLTKHDLGKEKFLERVWKWKEEQGGIILDQLKKLGVSCDWDYFTFTMDEVPNKAVRKVFKNLYDQKLIFQSDYIINWDPVLQSAISDAEVDHKEINGNFYHINYKVAGSDTVLEVATTRPETLFGDTAVAVNPNDERFSHLIGKKAILPILNKEIPIIGDEHVDMEKGTGCLKVTPGHDFNDFEIGQRAQLEIINILNKDATFNENAAPIIGLNIKQGRKKTIELLNEAGLLVDTKPHKQQVGHSQRSGAVVEPLVSKQWFLNIDQMAGRATTEVETEKMKFYPKGWENTYFSYMRNPRNWCISRQLWWGHEIPIYYCNSCDNTWCSEEQPKNCDKCESTDFRQDPDVLDTWFSSGLWPLSTLGWPDPEVMKERGFDKFYPNQCLVTGFDIIFFWVARMMMMCTHETNQAPFSDVYIHAIVRDKNGVKMSKSLGNIIDPLDTISEYGCDALRFTLSASSGYNRNINLDVEKIEGYRNFVNKLWNAFRFIQPNLDKATGDLPKDLEHHDRWILSELNSVTKSVNLSIEEYRLDDACSTVYQFVYDKFCSWYIELSKSVLTGSDEAKATNRANVLKYTFKQILKLLHPVIPFITEELWSYLKDSNEDLLITQEYPEYNQEYNFELDQENMNKFIEIVTMVRNLRQSVNIKPKEEIEVNFFTDDSALASYLNDSRADLGSLANVTKGTIKDKSNQRPAKSIFKATTHTEIYIPLEGVIDLSEQVKRIEKDIDKTQSELDKVSKKLGNEKFMSNAPIEVQNEVREKAAGYEEKLTSLKVSLENFKA